MHELSWERCAAQRPRIRTAQCKPLRPCHTAVSKAMAQGRYECRKAAAMQSTIGRANRVPGSWSGS
jgi:hypothetical protein